MIRNHKTNRSLLVVMLTLLLSAGHLTAQHQKTPVIKAWDHFSKNKEKSIYSGLHWTTLGPVVNSGRVETLDVMPGKPSTIFAGFGSGNLWKTTNNGFSWRPVFDDYPGYSIGDVCIAPSQTNIIYLGTGENLRARRGHTFAGAGVYRSDDEGETWKPLGLEDTYHIGRVAVHPENPDVVVVAALGHFYSPNKNRGLFRSENGGKSWKKVLYIDDRTGANDVVFAPSDPDIMYASTWTCSEAIGGAESSLYKSIDGGKNWKKIDNGFPKGDMNGRTGIAVSYSNSNKVYAFTDNLNLENNKETGELYLTEDGGKTWKKTHDGPIKILSTFGHVFTDCFINPRDDNEVYLLGVSLLRSSDGGMTFTPLRGDINNLVDCPANYFHVDHHDMWVNPADSDHLIVGNDGGLYISYDKGDSWFRYNNIPVGEFYFVRTDNQEPYNIYAGTQDDAAVYGPAFPLKENTQDRWKYVWIDPWSGGDGIVTAPDPEDPNIVYYEAQNGAIRRKNMTTGETVGIKPSLPETNKNELYTEWLTPFFVSQYNHATLYYGGNYLFKTVNRGNDWEVISPDLSASKDPERSENGLTTISESPMKRGLLYGGTSMGAVWVSKDDGVSWTEISDGLPAKYAKTISPSAFTESRVYICLNGIKTDDFSKHIYLSEDYGKTWLDISANLPIAPVNSVLEDPFNENILYAGTFNGVFVSVDRGKSWNVFGEGVPNSFVSDMTIQKREKDLIAGTHGRGIYKIDLEPLHALTEMDAGNAAILFMNEARLPLKDASGAKPLLSSYEDLRVDFYIPKEQSLEVSVKQTGSDEILFMANEKFQNGLNSFNWDLIIDRPDSDNPYHFKLMEFLAPGEYIISIKGEGVAMQREFDVKGGLY